MIPAPYLLYLGHSDDAVGIKTSRGLAAFRRDACVGEWRHDDSPLTLGLSRLDPVAARAAGARTLVLGIANAGGRLAPALIEDALAAIAAGLDVAAGLHQRLREEPRLVAAAAAAGVALHDVRDPPSDLRVGDGRPRAGKRLLTVGTDCSVGKMYATLCLRDELRARGVAADFRATGQTGILIAGEGVPVDAVVADFISGAIEALAPARDDDGWDLIEGQGSLFHPSFAGVTTGLLHGAQPTALLLCHDPSRAHMRGLPHYALPDLEECLAAHLAVARLTSPAVRAVGVALNTAALDEAAARRLCDETAARLALPCTDPYRFGASPIADGMLACFAP
ncbi:N-acetyltransferase DgcN [Sphingomonas sp. BK235]|uniref:N-acetyltransferase DgcN n=1 Tax=Sphingomonas sp. BK235 TaxID=2512131 RepID=UPI00104E9770|nr:N-acetyltransferase DgcN [Sphingomonas sp. BK235]TCP35887.1 putative NAD-dependent epimerase/dehydratase family protein [Sphingomonas sp. BK235]